MTEKNDAEKQAEALKAKRRKARRKWVWLEMAKGLMIGQKQP